MGDDNTQGAAEPSPASAGSHAALHRAVRALLDGVNARSPDKNPREWFCQHMQTLDDLTQSVPQLALTDEEWDAISDAIDVFAESAIHIDNDADRRRAETLRGLLRRLS